MSAILLDLLNVGLSCDMFDIALYLSIVSGGMVDFFIGIVMTFLVGGGVLRDLDSVGRLPSGIKTDWEIGRGSQILGGQEAGVGV